MKLLRIPLLTLAMLTAYASLPAQTVTVTAHYFSDSSGNLITGQLWWQPTLQNGTAASYRLGSGGQVTSLPVNVYVQQGAFSFTIADTSHDCRHVTNKSSQYLLSAHPHHHSKQLRAWGGL